MFRSKKESNKSNNNEFLTQLGFLNPSTKLDDFTNPLDDSNDVTDDEDLENELLQIVSSSSKASPRSNIRHKKTVPVQSTSNLENLDAMIAESLRDISDSEISDEEDPELLDELRTFTESPISPTKKNLEKVEEQNTSILITLNDRLKMYKEAEINAKNAGDSSKARRLGRGISSLNNLITKVENGENIDEDDIPLPVTSTTKQNSASVQNKEIVSANTDNNFTLNSPKKEESVITGNIQPEKESLICDLTFRMNQYKKAALTVKSEGDTQKAIEYVKVYKQFEFVINAVKSGQEVDLSTIPPPPPVESKKPSAIVPPPIPPRIKRKNSEIQESSDLTESIQKPVVPDEPLNKVQNPSINVLPPQQVNEEVKTGETLTILIALESRLQKFKQQMQVAQEENNSSKVRRMGRIVKQYEDAIKLHKDGKPIPIEDLPTPPGFPPIPVENAPQKLLSPEKQIRSGSPSNKLTPSPVPSPNVSPLPSPNVSPLPSPNVSPLPSPSTSRRSSAKQSSGTPVTRQEKQLEELLQKQKQFKDAALQAKSNGNIEDAKKFLRSYKGFEPLLEATRQGLPVDMSTLPILPESRINRPPKPPPSPVDFEILNMPSKTGEDVYNTLLTDLAEQLKMCLESKAHCKALGDIANHNRFDNLASDTKRDIGILRATQIRSDPLPKFRYEKRTFEIVKANSDISDNDLEIKIIRGIDFNAPNQDKADTYVIYELSYINDEVKTNRTSTVYNTRNPEFNAVFTHPIQRNRAFQRLFRRQAVKCQIWLKGGFLRSDILLGTVAVKLAPLENICTIHNCFDLMNGRKVVGGKLEVQIRLRNPMLTKQIERINKKWLIID